MILMPAGRACFAAGKTGWTPLNLPALAVWLDASDNATITQSTGIVSAWNDKSAGGTFDATQATSGLRPTVDANGLSSGKQAIVFVASSTQSLNLPSLASTGWTSGEMLYVCKHSADPPAIEQASGGPVRWHDVASGPASHEPYIDNSVYMRGLCSTTRHAVGNLTPAFTSPRIIGIHTGASNDFAYYLDGVSVFTASAGTFDPSVVTAPAVGIQQTSAAIYFDGALSEVIFNSATMSTLDRQKSEGYLAWKWGLAANLDSGHPYKAGPP